MASKMLSAPAHNMFAEKILGLADYHFRNAHNVKVDAKVKSKKIKLYHGFVQNFKTSRKKILNFV